MGEKVLSEMPVVKLQKTGDVIKGKMISMVESVVHKGSYALTLDNDGAKFVTFISSIVHDKLIQNGIEMGSVIKLTNKGKIKAKKSGREYYDIEIAVFD